jgi:predicted extracellular nuclease
MRTTTCLGLLLVVAAAARADQSHTIQQIQGAEERSRLVGTAVVDVTGVVTAVTSTSFTIQAPPDGELATSDALLVHVGRSFDGLPTVGDQVAVSGKVTEFAGRVNGEELEGALTQTQLERPVQVRVLASGCPLPEAVVVGASGRMPPVRAIAAGDAERFDAVAEPFDFWESLEHMRVVVRDAVVVGPTAHGELHVIPEGGEGYPQRTSRGGVLLANELGQASPAIIAIDNTPGARLPVVTVGDRIARLEGLLVPDATRPARLLVPALEGHVKGELPRAPTRLAGDEEHLTIASFNVENFSAVQPRRADDLARGVVRWLRSPAIVALQEIQDDDGPGAEGKPGHSDVVSAAATFAAICSAVVAEGGPSYRWLDIPPVAHMEGGEPGGNIRVGFLYDPARVTFEPRGAAGSLTPNVVESKDGRARLAFNPGRVAPDDPAFVETRRTLAAEFVFRGHRVVVLDSHFSSRREDDPAYGPRQPPTLHSEPKRIMQAQAVQRFVRDLAAADPQVTILHLGDCNDFHFRPALRALAGDTLEILTLRLPPEERYSYVFQGTSQPLDHALLGGPLRGTDGVEVEYVHINAEYPSNNRVSDHDPLVVRLHLP